ncbi:endonuclease/exonuclease/phosphatase family protein [Marinobacter zhanjiangensis]|uniref:EEP domain-containing protein n=1 Tax=Marinobacter zhanjiangensis TaxID=578215 RepID=A0ABQ3ANX0_9GAMM|nr:endonuclease/exonuclease/phosphatase family protein [Marinobacter zhanjiangensis]GGY61396.1 EEP domain-containing protein [Marinobacter zhanjiangensis]
MATIVSFLTETGGHLALRILTLNTHKGFGHFNRKFLLPELREAVRAVAADVVFMQEVQGAHEKKAFRHARWPDAPHYEFLADSIWPHHAYGRNAVYPMGHHGNALMSKFLIIDYRNVDASITKAEKRGLLHCRIDKPDDSDKPLHAFCVHLGLLEKHRQTQLEQLCDLVSSIPESEPVVVAGDFNDWQGKARKVMASCGLTDVFEARWGGPPKTFPAIFPLFRLDRIYVRGVSEHEPIKLPNRPWAHLSDHAPLAAEITL